MKRLLTVLLLSVSALAQVGGSGINNPGGGGGSPPGGSGTQVQLRLNGTTFQGLPNSSWNGSTLSLPSLSTTGLTISAITGTQCLHSIGGVISGIGADCGAGNASSGSSGAVQMSGGTGTFADTTISVATGNMTFAAGKSVGSADTGTPKITFGTNSLTTNQPLTVAESLTISGNGGTKFHENMVNIAQLPGNASCSTNTATNGHFDTCTPADGDIFHIKDGASDSDSTVGGGTSLHYVQYLGSCTCYVTLTVPAGRVTGLATIATSGSASDLGAGTIPYARFPGPKTIVGSGSITALSSTNGPSQIVVCTATCNVTPLTPPAANYQLCVQLREGVTGTVTLNALGNSAMYPKTDHSGYGTAGTGTMVSASDTGSAVKVCVFGSDATHYELGAVSSAAFTVN